VQEFSAVPKKGLQKVSSVEADIEKEGLGLSSEDREFLLTSQISVVFHVAASVRLNDTLAVAMKTNTLSVIEVARLCGEMPEIEVKKARSKYKPNLWRKYTFLTSVVFRTYLSLMVIYFRNKVHYLKNNLTSYIFNFLCSIKFILYSYI
jgi:hypothetical protein